MKLIEQIVEPDGRERVTFFERADGLIEFAVERIHSDDFPEYDYEEGGWRLIASGVHDTIAAARDEAAATAPWLRDAGV